MKIITTRIMRRQEDNHPQVWALALDHLSTGLKYHEPEWVVLGVHKSWAQAQRQQESLKS